jgi:hypothetical protein
MIKRFSTQHNKRQLLIILGYISLLIGFYIGEDSSGGSKKDFYITFPFISAISLNIRNGLELMITSNAVHFPMHYLIIGNLIKIFKNIEFVRFIFLNISMLAPLIFYKCLLILYNNKENAFLISFLLFFSPYFRSSAIWATTDNTALIFFLLSIFFLLKIYILKEIKLINFILSAVFLILASYTRQYYFLFFFYYIYICTNKEIINKKIFIIISLFTILLMLPSLYYSNLLNTKIIKGYYISKNFVNNLYIFLSIVLFYLLPYLLLSKKNLEFFLIFVKKNLIYLLIIIIFFLVLSINFTYNANPHGGGIIYQVLNRDFLLNIFFILCAVSAFLIIFFFKDFFILNILLILIIFFSFYYNTIFQKYYDPLLLILFTTLFQSVYIKNAIIKLNIKYKYYYSYFFLFYLILLFKNLFTNS